MHCHSNVWVSKIEFFSDVHQGYICLIKNTVKTEILWFIITN